MSETTPSSQTTSPAITAGSPVWVDLGVPDLTAVQGFYETLFGWEFEDMGPDYGHYHLVTNGGAPVGGAMSMQDDFPDEGSAWTIYLKSDDIEAALSDTAAAGGNVMVPAMPMPGLGSMGLVTTPGGEAVGLWQADGFEGFELNRAVGAPVWFEVMSFDVAADAEYYRTVWGWEPTRLGDDGQETGRDGGGEDADYANNHPGEAATAGLCKAPREWFPEGTPSFWRAYFLVEDADAAAEQIRQLGGTVMDGPMDTPFGRLATVADPAGASFQIAQMPAE